MAKSVQRTKKTGLIVGVVLFALVVLGGGAGLWLLQKGTDNRSQASAEPVAQIKVASQKDKNGTPIYSLAVDISQMKKGTTVTDFSTQIFVPARNAPPVSEPPRPSGIKTGGSTNGSPIGDPQPVRYCDDNGACPADSVCSHHLPDCSGGVDGGATCTPSKEPSICVPQNPTFPPRPTRDTSPEPPTTEVLAKSEDGRIRILGTGPYAQVKHLNVSIQTAFTSDSDSQGKPNQQGKPNDSRKPNPPGKPNPTSVGYLITLSGETNSQDQDLQMMFAAAKPLFLIVPTDKAVELSLPTVKQVSIKGYLPGLKTVVELTKPTRISPTQVPRPTNPSITKPPMKVTPSPLPTKVAGECQTSKDCPKGYACAQPPMPRCNPGEMCVQVLPPKQCVPMKPQQKPDNPAMNR